MRIISLLDSPLSWRFLVWGADSVKLHRKWTNCLLKWINDGLLFGILGFEVSYRLRHLTDLHSIFFFFFSHLSHNFFHLLILGLVEILLILRFEYLKFHLSDLFFKCFKIFHKLHLELILLLRLLLQLHLLHLDNVLSVTLTGITMLLWCIWRVCCVIGRVLLRFRGHAASWTRCIVGCLRRHNWRSLACTSWFRSCQ